MSLLKEILVSILEKEEIQISFPDLPSDMGELIETRACGALRKIKAIIQDDSLSDFDCIEEIVCVLEMNGSSGGGRHDF